ncbi:MAG: DUF1569 domain-containing protein [Chitinophagaceae bacterium]|nr:DUF1569 domain-containing protein [Chitinophagaceae bacterium]
MKNLFHDGVEAGIQERIAKLSPSSSPLWGKMNVAQMLAHCICPLELAMGEATAAPSGFFKKLLGRLIKGVVVSPKPYKHDLPTDPTFVTVTDSFEFQTQKDKLLSTIARFIQKQDTVADFKHPFFGKLTKDEWGMSQYKHLDHHLNQFGV